MPCCEDRHDLPSVGNTRVSTQLLVVARLSMVDQICHKRFWGIHKREFRWHSAKRTLSFTFWYFASCAPELKKRGELCDERPSGRNAGFSEQYISLLVGLDPLEARLSALDTEGNEGEILRDIDRTFLRLTCFADAGGHGQ